MLKCELERESTQLLSRLLLLALCVVKPKQPCGEEASPHYSTCLVQSVGHGVLFASLPSTGIANLDPKWNASSVLLIPPIYLKVNRNES